MKLYYHCLRRVKALLGSLINYYFGLDFKCISRNKGSKLFDNSKIYCNFENFSDS